MYKILKFQKNNCRNKKIKEIRQHKSLIAQKNVQNFFNAKLKTLIFNNLIVFKWNIAENVTFSEETYYHPASAAGLTDTSTAPV